MIMRTTLVLNDELVAEAKRKAADRQVSLSTIVNEALRSALLELPAETGKVVFAMPTYRPGKAAATDLSPGDMHQLLAAEEAAPYHQ